jgi:hypothetical protein
MFMNVMTFMRQMYGKSNQFNTCEYGDVVPVFSGYSSRSVNMKYTFSRILLPSTNGSIGRGHALSIKDSLSDCIFI